MKYLFRAIAGTAFLITLLLLGLMLSVGAQGVIELMLKLVGVNVEQHIIVAFTEQTSDIFIYSLLILNILFVILAVWHEKYFIRKINNALHYIRNAFVNLFTSLNFPEAFIMIIIPLLASIYFALNIPVSYDEAATYNYFTVKPFYFSMIFYPYPNNHVLHSLVTNLTEYIPFLPPLFCLRLPVILTSLFTWLIVYSFIKKYYNSNTALLVLGLMTAMFLSIYYSFMSRGYAFLVLAFVICMYASFNIINQANKNKDWMFFVLAGALGCYAIPSFLYPFATLNAVILVNNYKGIKKQVIANVFAGVLVVLLYSPIMFVDGIAALTSNQFVQQVDRAFIIHNIFHFCQAMIAEIVGAPLFFIYILLIPLGYALLRKDKKYIMLWMIFMFAPFILLLLHSVSPFYRTFLYYNFIIAFLFFIPFHSQLGKLHKLPVLLLVLFVQSIGVYSFNEQIGIKEGFNTDVSKVVKTYFKDSNKILFPCIASENYKFEAKVRGLDTLIDFQENEEINIDTLSMSYDYIIVEKKRDRTVQRQPYASSDKQNIYKNEK